MFEVECAVAASGNVELCHFDIGQLALYVTAAADAERSIAGLYGSGLYVTTACYDILEITGEGNVFQLAVAAARDGQLQAFAGDVAFGIEVATAGGRDSV